ncbi:beta-2-microglobulin [Geospiza fortis]|uniref:Beta-2-microglobulin n=1 Tax=Geospiza fortis TaxID=48883 RepID=A0A6I9HNA4_GEOFO|nr:beta-2-microglobulin [Geospiza fortis]
MAAPSGALRLRTALHREPGEQWRWREAPKVEVYARSRAEEGKANTLHCFVTGFHPPKIDIELLKNGVPMPGVTYGDLSFNDKWQFQRLVYAPFTPTTEDIFSCRVAHSTMPEARDYKWEPDF